MVFPTEDTNLKDYSKQNVVLKKQELLYKKTGNSNFVRGQLANQQAIEYFRNISNDVQDNIFILTADSNGLDVLASNMGLERGSLNDTELRNLLLQQSTLSVTNMTRSEISNLIFLIFGETVDYIFIQYFDGYNPERGGNYDDDNGDRISFTTWGSRNYAIVYKLVGTHSDSYLQEIQDYIKNFIAITSWVYVR